MWCGRCLPTYQSFFNNSRLLVTGGTTAYTHSLHADLGLCIILFKLQNQISKHKQTTKSIIAYITMIMQQFTIQPCVCVCVCMCVCVCVCVCVYVCVCVCVCVCYVWAPLLVKPAASGWWNDASSGILHCSPPHANICKTKLFVIEEWIVAKPFYQYQETVLIHTVPVAVALQGG